ncbi:DHHC palmitoyltransferase-domain-containing protein [Mycena sp. CBHHK59/15]|nr:DHHC palmitoyltransferase-domain-containing protein [Mycena sp. CBHHK59/15]
MSIDKNVVVRERPTCCGTITEAKYTARSPYVYTGRFSVRLMHGGRRASGIALLVVFCILYAWMIWAYVKVIFTPPGNARDHISKSPQPLFPRQTTHAQSWDSSHTDSALHDIEQGRIGGPSYEQLNQPSTPPAAHIQGTALPLPEATLNPAPQNGRLGSPPPPNPSRWKNQRREGPRMGRFPPTTPMLLPQHRWCTKCEILKPYRAHHCRVCGTCVLKFDHHCPWIGQCVGAQNHKFFFNFSVATAFFTLFTFATLLAYNINNDRNIDPQEVVIIALAALFALFTLSLATAHTRLILLSQTTVESLSVSRLKERESAAFGACEFGTKRRALASYNAEWGHPNTEGNIWWMGSTRAGWEDTMGRSWLGWIFPIGGPLSDGLSYPVNPRFDAQGRWRRRSEWPEALR